MTRKQELQYRKHIKPFLRYAIKSLMERNEEFLCLIAGDYCESIGLEYKGYLHSYLRDRIQAARPTDSGIESAWTFKGVKIESDEYYQIKIDWCKQQLKIVDETETKYN